MKKVVDILDENSKGNYYDITTNVKTINVFPTSEEINKWQLEQIKRQI